MFKTELLEKLETWTFQQAIEKFNYLANMNQPSKKRTASSTGTNNANSRPNKKQCNHQTRNRKNGGNNKAYPGGGKDGRSGRTLYYDTETGQPLGRYINGIDLEPLFTKGKMPEANLTRLPNIVKKWFAENPNTNKPGKRIM